jgi:N utilization substance protein A
MKSDFYTAIAQIAAERGIPREAVLSSVEHALKSVYAKMAHTEEEVSVEIESGTGNMRVFVHKRVVAEIEDPVNDLTLAEAQEYAPDAQIGDEIRIEKTPENFGRIAAQTVKQVVLQKIRDYDGILCTRNTKISKAKCSAAWSNGPIRVPSSSSSAKPKP